MHQFHVAPLGQSALYRNELRKKRFVKKLRLNATPEEIMLHGALLKAFHPYRVTVCFQEQIGPFVADFFLYPINIVIEVDGGIHSVPKVASKDKRRDTFMRNRGIKILRFSNLEVGADANAVVARIIAECGTLPKAGDPVTVTKCPPGSAIHGKKRSSSRNRIKRVP